MDIIPSEHAAHIETSMYNVRHLLDGANSIDRLRALHHVRATIEHEIDLAVTNARAMGMSWAAISKVFGITRQSAHEKWARTSDPHIP